MIEATKWIFVFLAGIFTIMLAVATIWEKAIARKNRRRANWEYYYPALRKGQHDD